MLTTTYSNHHESSEVSIMGKIIYVTGGARSGKSEFAENLLKHENKVLYIATAYRSDDEMKERIRIHRENRNQNWDTLEAYKDFDTSLEKHLTGKAGILFDCVTIMVSNQMLLDRNIDWDNTSVETVKEIENDIAKQVKKLIDILKNFNGISVIVSNELGMGLVPPYPLGRHFRDIAGRVNKMLAKEADEAFFMVSGLPIKLK